MIYILLIKCICSNIEKTADTEVLKNLDRKKEKLFL